MLLLPWLVGGFLMSMTSAYITAHELVALLVSLGRILGVSPSVLGLTVLAWGNSVGDLVANVAMAVKGGRRGTQVVISGCYAGGHLRVLISLLRKGSVVVYLLHAETSTDEVYAELSLVPEDEVVASMDWPEVTNLCSYQPM